MGGHYAVAPGEWLRRLGWTMQKSRSDDETEGLKNLERIIVKWQANTGVITSINMAIRELCDTETERLSMIKMRNRVHNCVQRTKEKMTSGQWKSQTFKNDRKNQKARRDASAARRAASAAKQDAPKVEAVYFYVESSTESDSDGEDTGRMAAGKAGAERVQKEREMEGRGEMQAAGEQGQGRASGSKVSDLWLAHDGSPPKVGKMQAAGEQGQGRASGSKVSELWLAHMGPPPKVSDLWLAHTGT